MQARSGLVGQETDHDKNDKHWVLPDKEPCAPTRVLLGGMNVETPERSFDPVDVEKPLVSNDVDKIKEHYHFQCGKLSAAAFEFSPKPGCFIKFVLHYWKRKTIEKCLPHSKLNASNMGCSKVYAQAVFFLGLVRACCLYCSGV